LERKKVVEVSRKEKRIGGKEKEWKILENGGKMGRRKKYK
jgi:hypothetical protein